MKTLFVQLERTLRAVVQVLGILSGLSVLAMMGVTCADVILRLRWVNHPFIGAYDIVKIAGALSLATALPYTTAINGHVAIEYFVNRFGRRGRWLLGIATRLTAIGLFAFLSWRSVLYGLAMQRNGEVSLTLQLPIFWIPLVMGFCCAMVVLVLVTGLAHPDREMIRP